MKVNNKSLIKLEQERYGGQTRQRSENLEATVKSSKNRHKDSLELLNSGLKEYSRKVIENRNLLEQITKTPEYLNLKANTLFGRKGPIP